MASYFLETVTYSRVVHSWERSERSQQQKLDFHSMFSVPHPRSFDRLIYEVMSVIKKQIKIIISAMKDVFSLKADFYVIFYKKKLTIPGEILGGTNGGAPRKL